MLNNFTTNCYIKGQVMKARAKGVLSSNEGMEMLQMLIIIAVILGISLAVILFGDQITGFFTGSGESLANVTPTTLKNPNSK